MPKNPPAKKTVAVITHTEDKRKNIPSAEYQPVVDEKTKQVIPLFIPRRDPDLDPQLVWRGKEEQNWTTLTTQAPPLYI
jgi:adenine-specific DNA-methyltransferase